MWPRSDGLLFVFFKNIHQISSSHWTTNRQFWAELGVFGLLLQFEFIDGYKMMHKVWCSTKEVFNAFSRSSLKLKVTQTKNADFYPNWLFLECDSSLNWPMATKWCTKLDVALKKVSYRFQRSPSNIKVSQDKKLPNLTRIGCLRSITPLLIHWSAWNYA